MKKLLYSVLAAASMVAMASCGGAKHNVEVTMPELASKSVLVVAVNALGDEKTVTDTIQVDENGHFVYDLPFNHASSVVIYENMTREERMASDKALYPVEAIVIPGTPLVITGTMEDPQFDGGAFYTELAAAQAPLDSISKLQSDIYGKMREAQANGELTDSVRESFMAQLGTLRDSYKEYSLQYIKDNPDSDVATVMVTNLGIDNYDEGLDILTDRAKNGPLAPLYQTGLEQKAKREAREQAAKDLVGQPAPGFTLPNPEGEMISLESLRGKYVLVDFWGSWCGWCIKGIPEMKKAYEKYKDVAEFISVDCRDSEEAWKKALDEYKMPWLHVRCDDDCDLPEVYCIQGYPTKVIIDPEGVYVTAIIGESEEGYKTMEEIFGKKK